MRIYYMFWVKKKTPEPRHIDRQSIHRQEKPWQGLGIALCQVCACLEVLACDFVALVGRCQSCPVPISFANSQDIGVTLKQRAFLSWHV